MARRRRLARAARLALLLVVGVVVGAPGAAPVRAQEARGADADLAAARERWRAMDEAERGLLRRRFAAFQRLAPEDRRLVEERARRWSALEPELRGLLTPDERARLEGLAPAARRRAWLELVRDQHRASGRRLRADLPGPLRARLEGATVDELRAVLGGLRRRREAHCDRALGRLGVRLGLAPEALTELRARPLAEKLELVLHLRRSWLEARLDAQSARGLAPLGLDPDAWRALKGASDEVFLRAVRLRGLRPARRGGPAG